MPQKEKKLINSEKSLIKFNNNINQIVENMRNAIKQLENDYHEPHVFHDNRKRRKPEEQS